MAISSLGVVGIEVQGQRSEGHSGVGRQRLKKPGTRRDPPADAPMPTTCNGSCLVRCSRSCGRRPEDGNQRTGCCRRSSGIRPRSPCLKRSDEASTALQAPTLRWPGSEPKDTTCALRRDCGRCCPMPYRWTVRVMSDGWASGTRVSPRGDFTEDRRIAQSPGREARRLSPHRPAEGKEVNRFVERYPPFVPERFRSGRRLTSRWLSTG